MKRSIIVLAIAASALFGGVAQSLAVGTSTAEQQNKNGLQACALVAEAKVMGVSAAKIPTTVQLCRMYQRQVALYGGY